MAADRPLPALLDGLADQQPVRVAAADALEARGVFGRLPAVTRPGESAVRVAFGRRWPR